MQLQVTNRTSVQLVPTVLDGKLDLAVVNLPIEDERLCVPVSYTHLDVYKRQERRSESRLVARPPMLL